MTRLETSFNHAVAMLSDAGVATARLDALVLLEDTLGINRARILAAPDMMLAPEQGARFLELIQRRARHEPLAYIRQKTEFYGREFYVDGRVLEPRPESETIIDLLKLLPLPEYPTIIDVGTGSGALAVTAKLELPAAHVIGVDIDSGCLEVASHNVAKHQVAVTMRISDLVASLADTNLDCATLLCNLPYVPNDFHINTAATHEPKLAIFGGSDGLDLYRQLFQQIRERVVQPANILAEALPLSHPALTKIASDAQYVLEHTDDFVQVFRKAAGSSVS